MAWKLVEICTIKSGYVWSYETWSKLVLCHSVRLTCIDELDCSFNEIEALPSSIGQCVSIRTFAADHNFLTQLPPEVSVFVGTFSVRCCTQFALLAHDSGVLLCSSHSWATGRTQLFCFCIPTSWNICLRRWGTCRDSKLSIWATTSESWLTDLLYLVHFYDSWNL